MGFSPYLFASPVGLILEAIQLLLVLFEVCIIGRAIFSWIEPYPKNPINLFFCRVTEPVVAPIRRILPPMGGIDLSLFVVLIIIGILIRLL